MPVRVEIGVGEDERRMWPEVVERRRRGVGGRSWRRAECRAEMGVLEGRGSVKLGRPGKVLMSALMMWGAMIAVVEVVVVEMVVKVEEKGREAVAMFAKKGGTSQTLTRFRPTHSPGTFHTHSLTDTIYLHSLTQYTHSLNIFTHSLALYSLARSRLHQISTSIPSHPVLKTRKNKKHNKLRIRKSTISYLHPRSPCPITESRFTRAGTLIPPFKKKRKKKEKHPQKNQENPPQPSARE